jgi:hypothetical protein
VQAQTYILFAPSELFFSPTFCHTMSLRQ